MPDRQVSMSDVARQLEVTLSAVSNWRRRHPSFPSAEKVNGQEMFLVREIVDWLDGRKISKKDLKPGELPGTTYGTRFRGAMRIGHASHVAIADALWDELIQFRGAEDVAMFADLVLGLLYLAVSNDRHWNDIVATEGSRRLQLMELAALDHRPVLHVLHRARSSFFNDTRGETRLTEIIRLVERMRRSGQGPDMFEFLLNQFAAAEGRRGSGVHTPAALVRLLVELVAPAPGTSVFDPCCGSGGFLLGAAKYIAAHAGHDFDASFTGHALSERSASLAYMNLQLHHVPADVDIRADALFRNDGMLIANERFDVVLSNPPFDLKEPMWSASVSELHGRYGTLPKKRTNFAWLQYVMSSLTNSGRAAVVMPGGTLFRGGAEGQVRANMIEEGVVEAIIALPSQMFVSTGIPVNVWLLRPSERREGEILLIDASDLGHLTSRTQRSLSDEDQSRIGDTVKQWRAGDGYENVRGFSASVVVQRIREQDYVLTPARYVGTSVELNPPLRSVRELRDDLARLERRAAAADAAVERQLDRI
ncbi:N-6 DNA methylase [Actinocrispum wychmicini]|uniref:site-specific DNA-methyltransferase (adenine-specific) n=1 Tax=Actinocrispum wychmicini TaxID=1213861 RepID=A0A4R2K5M6_9PSEU|nr:N-6 DNA methylase [Actinocrispum wychmicini]TCO65098.1 type I restriction enzyme M protein [Actinocrispum wychmicini]